MVIYDVYRPASSIKYFIEQMNDVNDTIKKKYNYPYFETKTDMEDRYIASIRGL